MSGLPLIRGDDLDQPIAWRDGEPVSRRRYLADVHTLCALLPGAGPMLNVTADRYHFAVGLGAAMLRGQDNLMPPNHTPDMVARLHGLFPSAYALADEAAAPVQLPMVWHPHNAPASTAPDEVPLVDADMLVAQVLTSGSTGAPVPHAKRWGLLVNNTRAGVQRLAEQMGRSNLAGVTLVATVPPQHMYGFESTVLVALLGGAAFDAERPFYPADIARALARAPRPRMLVTTPFHLKTLLDSGTPLPPIDLTVCATAPLSPQLAARAESALAAPLMEIYGCTEAGQVASRRTTDGPEWHTYEGLRLSGDGDQSIVQDGHVPQPTLLADVLEVIDSQTFRLLGRSNDLINIAGKRSSLSHLNYHLNSIAGIHDGSFWLPPDEPGHGIVRLTAFVVAPDIAPAALHEHIVSALRQRVDAAFLPRRVIKVPALPREPTGKLPAGLLDAWAATVLERQSPRLQPLDPARG
ncbi:MAG: AMP-binding protein [Burkholderiaceae bacterium]